MSRTRGWPGPGAARSPRDHGGRPGQGQGAGARVAAAGFIATAAGLVVGGHVLALPGLAPLAGADVLHAGGPGVEVSCHLALVAGVLAGALAHLNKRVRRVLRQAGVRATCFRARGVIA